MFTWINNRVLTWETCWELITWINKAVNYEQNNKCLSHTVHKHLLLIAMHCIAWCVKQLVHVWSIISAKCRKLETIEQIHCCYYYFLLQNYVAGDAMVCVSIIHFMLSSFIYPIDGKYTEDSITLFILLSKCIVNSYFFIIIIICYVDTFLTS